jgi:hypothetical protein
VLTGKYADGLGNIKEVPADASGDPQAAGERMAPGLDGALGGFTGRSGV